LLNAGTPVPGHQLRGGNFNARVDLAPSTSTGLRLSSRFASTDATSFPDDSGGSAFAVLRDVDRRETGERGFGAEFEQAVSDGTAFRLQAQYFQREEHGTSPGVAAGVRDPFGIPPNGGDTRLQRYNVVASGLFEVSQSVRLTIGLASERERGVGDGFLEFSGTPVPTSFALSRSTRAAFLEAQHASRDGRTLHGGLRLDDRGFSRRSVHGSASDIRSAVTASSSRPIGRRVSNCPASSRCRIRSSGTRPSNRKRARVSTSASPLSGGTGGRMPARPSSTTVS
jgi:hypothetical protein